MSGGGGEECENVENLIMICSIKITLASILGFI